MFDDEVSGTLKRSPKPHTTCLRRRAFRCSRWVIVGADLEEESQLTSRSEVGQMLVRVVLGPGGSLAWPRPQEKTQLGTYLLSRVPLPLIYRIDVSKAWWWTSR